MLFPCSPSWYSTSNHPVGSPFWAYSAASSRARARLSVISTYYRNNVVIIGNHNRRNYPDEIANKAVVTNTSRVHAARASRDFPLPIIDVVAATDQSANAIQPAIPQNSGDGSEKPPRRCTSPTKMNAATSAVVNDAAAKPQNVALSRRVAGRGFRQSAQASSSDPIGVKVATAPNGLSIDKMLASSIPK